MDVDAYLRRIGHRSAAEPGRALLDAIVQRHVASIAFENLDAFLGRRVSLDPGTVERKLVHEARGGWCFEQNLLMGEALRALGFDVADLAGRVLWNRPPDAVTARTHRLLLVHADGRDWLVDVGFGGHTLTGVLDLHDEQAQETSHEPFRLRPINGEERVMESLIAGQWKPLCRFDLTRQLPIDFEAANYQLAHDPASHFTQVLIVSRVADDGRHVLHGRELVFHRSGGQTRRRNLETDAAVATALREVFGLNIDPGTQAALLARLDAQAGTAARS
jgi:N-hydroxyarylamine O-acetyltransferase